MTALRWLGLAVGAAFAFVGVLILDGRAFGEQASLRKLPPLSDSD